ncbi:alpha/beta hydrolase [Zooshikella ganghwensis]|uniref:Alpha/beta hydrolase n=1 Tax=Zooshikella ganghwensis TaxID=202772 RepID=A0A4P9VLE5_9GAMM|nr:CocE/NonD family hydrolase [Zooshikella ganghwensis]RDH44123.1 alpha/beta hydrolase [Zooshikella ganghwensis]
MKSIQLNTTVGTLAANLYLPEHVEKPPVVIVTGAWTTVKEQMPAIYAKALVEKGYAALTFDFRGWGQSDDEIKYLEDPQRKTEDIKAVFEVVSELDGVDGTRMAGLGICASAGYMLDAVSGNLKVKTAAVVAPWLHNKALVNVIYGSEETVNSLLEAGKKAEQADAPVYIEAASNINENALMYQAPYYNESDRGLIPEYDNRFNIASWKGWLNYDAINGAEKQDKPVMIEASEAMALPQGTKDYLSSAGDNVKAVWLDDVTQFDFYDVPKHVAVSVSAIVESFSTHL